MVRTHVIDEHALPRITGGRVRTVLSVSIDGKTGAPHFYTIKRELLLPGKDAWEIMERKGGVKLRIADLFRIMSIAAIDHAEYVSYRATKRRRREAEAVAKKDKP
jgi:hypothetical protein